MVLCKIAFLSNEYSSTETNVNTTVWINKATEVRFLWLPFCSRCYSSSPLIELIGVKKAMQVRCSPEYGVNYMDYMIDEFSRIYTPINIDEKIENKSCSLCKQMFEDKVIFVNGYRVGRFPICPKCLEKETHKNNYLKS